jgi:hypothetical protein
VLQAAHSLEEHAAQLSAGIASSGGAEHNLGFLEEFVRPYGLGTPATPRLVEAVERLGGGGTENRRLPAAVGAAVRAR